MSSHTPTLATATVVPSAILAGSNPRPLSHYHSLVATFVLLETHALVFWHCLYLCGPRTFSPFKFTQQSTSLLSCPVGKNIRRVILFEWVILFKNPTITVLIGNYIHRVNVIKGLLYSRVHSTIAYANCVLLGPLLEQFCLLNITAITIA